MNEPLQPQCWVIFRRPDELPADALPGDWPGPYVARRFARNDKAEMIPTEDVAFGPTAHFLRHTITLLYSVKSMVMSRQPRTPEDHETIVETIFVRPRMASPELVVLQERMPSGMKVDEAVERAERWWDTQGRHTIRKQFNEHREGGEIVPTIPSGILKALPWAMLTRREQVAVVLRWHDHKVASKEG